MSLEITELMKKERYDFDDLAAITRILRSEEGCPWDREQDHHSVRTGLIEETYEVVEAVDNDDPVLLREELGDLLFQIMFHARIEEECKRFAIGDVVDDIAKKMIHRHPHVFGDVTVADSTEVLKNWDSIKTEEKQRNTLEQKLRAIPPMMPALMRASKVGKKAGVSNDPAEVVADKLIVKLQALKAGITSADYDAQSEMGALLMGLCDLSRTLGVDAELALSRQTDRLIDSVCDKNNEKM